MMISLDEKRKERIIEWMEDLKEVWGGNPLDSPRNVEMVEDAEYIEFLIKKDLIDMAKETLYKYEHKLDLRISNVLIDYDKGYYYAEDAIEKIREILCDNDMMR